MSAKEKSGLKVKEKDREIWMGGNNIYLGENHIVYVSIVAEQTEKKAITIQDALFKLVNLVNGEVKVLANNSESGKASSQARKISREMPEHEKVGKVAIFGLHPVARVIAFFVMVLSKNKDWRFFKTKEETLAWLKE